MIEVFMLVATLVGSGLPGPTRVVSAEWPFFRTMAECQQAVKSMQKIPRLVDTVVCEKRTLQMLTGRVR
jgi:hypothetical protein